MTDGWTITGGEPEAVLARLQRQWAAAQAQVDVARQAWYQAQDEHLANQRALERATGADVPRITYQLQVCAQRLSATAVALEEAKHRAAFLQDLATQHHRQAQDRRQLASRIGRYQDELQALPVPTRDPLQRAKLAAMIPVYAQTLERLASDVGNAQTNALIVGQEVARVGREIQALRAELTTS